MKTTIDTVSLAEILEKAAREDLSNRIREKFKQISQAIIDESVNELSERLRLELKSIRRAENMAITFELIVSRRDKEGTNGP